MSRSTSIMGLPPKAQEFLSKHIAWKKEFCPCCNEGQREVRSTFPHKDETSAGMFDDGPMLVGYDMKEYHLAEDKREWFIYLVEEIQAIPWASGPCIFLKLCLPSGKDFITWTQEEMEERL